MWWSVVIIKQMLAFSWLFCSLSPNTTLSGGWQFLILSKYVRWYVALVSRNQVAWTCFFPPSLIFIWYAWMYTSSFWYSPLFEEYLHLYSLTSWISTLCACGRLTSFRSACLNQRSLSVIPSLFICHLEVSTLLSAMHITSLSIIIVIWFIWHRVLPFQYLCCSWFACWYCWYMLIEATMTISWFVVFLCRRMPSWQNFVSNSRSVSL